MISWEKESLSSGSSAALLLEGWVELGWHAD